ncbi:hypothetical protein NEOLEDRAFT_1128937 [Neolentinus lepideus HHB14362 ss-1]|uniref:NOT2/NOT3/NOT5 C-terminal domain-containing protein n=1 Tax=Neolentinus lepideus HHB14362 ss-1 TaxID=1314782 RepID=A0A165UV21_9AGAM|nr:hypothetical protein NEOLEDRAFT_1128937 [Neolentinus lepideus HHB14362 ss-1]
MNRPGQPPQRPPSLAPTPGLGGHFRGPYPSYGLPPRNVMQGYPNLPNHRTPQSLVPQPSPNFIQQRAQSAFPFGSTTQTQQQSLPHTQQQQQQTTTTQPASSSLPPHLAHQTQPAPSTIGTAPSVSSASEVGLDPNDFPALGSGSAAASNSMTPGATGAGGASYASQAGGVAVQGSASTSAGNQPRDFTPDDFPALSGGQAQQPSQPAQDSHPPGLNGFSQQHSGEQQHRQALIGSLTSSQPSQVGQGQQQPGLLNLGQSRSIHSGFQSEVEKQRNYAMKLNQTSHPAWPSPNPNNGSQPQGTPAPTNTVPTGPTSFPAQSQQQQQQNGAQSQSHYPQPLATPYVGNGNGNGESGGVPQTPAQQVLMSPADRWGLLGLIAMIKNADLDQSLLSVGTDLGTMGLDMTNPGNLYSTFITPWADSAAAHTVEPDFHLPGCYNVHPPPPGPNKAAAFSDETLFFMFYSSPRDAMQEVAAQELWNRNWRYHKELRLWITKEAGTNASHKLAGGESGTYTYWDPDSWEKARKDMAVMYADLEEKSSPAFAPGLTLQMPPRSVSAAQFPAISL